MALYVVWPDRFRRGQRRSGVEARQGAPAQSPA